MTVTLFHNGAATASTCTIAAGNNTCTIAGGLALAQGDKLELEVTGTGTTALTTTATTAYAETVPTVLTAPGVTTSVPNEQVVYLFGTGSTSFATGNGLPVTIGSGASATGADDTSQPLPGAVAAESVTSTTPADWVAQSVALVPTLPSSITVNPAPGYVAGNFELISIGVQNLGTGGLICPAGTGWTAAETQTSGTGKTELTQESFWTMSAPSSYVFDFKTSSCTGPAVDAGAEALAINYTGVNGTPLDVAPVETSGNGSAIAAHSITPAAENDMIVGLYATDSPTLTGTTVSQLSSWGSGGANYGTDAHLWHRDDPHRREQFADERLLDLANFRASHPRSVRPSR